MGNAVLVQDADLAAKREEAYDLLNRMATRLKTLESALILADKAIVLSLEGTKSKTKYKSAYAATKALMEPPDPNKLPKMLAEAHSLIQSALAK